jgi:hypothetical protein
MVAHLLSRTGTLSKIMKCLNETHVVTMRHTGSLPMGTTLYPTDLSLDASTYLIYEQVDRMMEPICARGDLPHTNRWIE